MECLFDGCDNFVRYLNNQDWVIESEDKRLAIKKGLEWANFIEVVHSKLEAEDKLEEFVLGYSEWRQVMGLAPLQFAGFKSACDELLRNILINHTNFTEVVEIALDEYHGQCGEERTLVFLKHFSAESLLLKLFTTFICNKANFEDSETQDRLSKAIWYDIMLRLLPEEISRDNDRCRKQLNELLDSKTGIETLIFLAILREPHLENLQTAVMSLFQQNMIDVDNEQLVKFWQNFVRSDSTLLLLLFKRYEEFLEEFFEYFLRFVPDVTREMNEEGDDVWTSSSWLQFQDVVSVIKLLTTCEDKGLSSYVSHIVDSMADLPLWKAVNAQIKL